MHLLLPPSETKTAGGRGRSLRHHLARHPVAARHPLAEGRQTTISALAELVAGDPAAAARALQLPDGVAFRALRADAAVLDSPTMPALRRYAGTVYDGLAYSSMTATEQRLAARSTLIFSGLFGVVRGDESVPDYRVPAKAVLPDIGVVATFWRPVLTPVLNAVLHRGFVLDLRSGDYAAMWRPSGPLRDRVIAVRVLSPLARGGHAVISYQSKLGKGRLAAELLRRAAVGRPPEGVADVTDAWHACGGVAAVAVAGGLVLHTG